MGILKATSFLPLLIAILLLSCIPIPYTIDYADAPDPDEVVSQLQKLQSSGASRSTVIETLGRPLRYRQDHISYEVCKDIYGVAILIGLMYYGGGFTAYESDLQCFELRIDFDEHEKLKCYRELPRDWKYDEQEEDLTLKELGKQGDAIAQRLWKQSRTYYTSQDNEVIEERIENNQERTNKRELLSTSLKSKAEAGDAEAQYQLFLLEDRIPVKWLCRAADQEYFNARLELAYLYGSGAYGFPQDFKRSYIWYRLAGSGEHREAVDKWIKILKKPSFWNAGKVCEVAQACYIASQIVQLQGMLTPAGLSEAERMLEKWEPGLCERDLLEAIPEEKK
jgi:hypothetical protein